MSLATLVRPRTAAEPGPGPMPEGILRALDITVGRRVSGLLQGDYRSSSLGPGTELAQIRPYEPGDDVRLIDWNVTARMREPHVRAHVAERILTTWLILDTSPSMTFGTADRRKADVAEGVAIAVGQIATRRGNNLGLVSFGEGSPKVTPPAQGRAGVLSLLTALRTEHPRSGPGGSLGDALRTAGRLARWSKLVVIVSDFRCGKDWEIPLLELSARHAVICVEIRDPREQEMPNVGDLWLVDPETGRRLRVDTSRKGIRERFAAAAAEERATVAQAITRAGAHHVVLSTAGDWLRTFVGAVSTKGVRR
ncbi:MAG: DUF58 domain-containing protein [Dehalococcoidia bacterium]